MSEERYDEISLKELIMTLINEGKLIVFITGVILFCTLLFTFYQSFESKSGKAIVSFNFSGISNHKNPDGTSFDPYQIATPFILSDVIDQLELEGQVSPNSIRSLVEMTPIIPKSITTKEDFLLEKEGETITYYPNEYILTVNSSRKKGIDAYLAQKIANQIVLSYKDYFTNEYILQKPIVNKLSTFNPDKYDYSDISMVIHSQLNEVKSFNNALSALDENFRSKRTGMTFYDIIQLLDNTDKVDLNKLDSMISSYKLTKDNTRLILYYEYLVEQLTYEKNKALSQKNVTKDMLENIEDSSNSILSTLSGTTNDSSNSYFNSLILRTANTGTNISNISERIDYYNNEITELKNGPYIVDYDKEAILAEAEALISTISDDINKWMELSKETSEEFYDQYLSNSFYALSPAVIDDSGRPLLNLAIGAVLGLMLGIFAAFFKAYWNSEKEVR